MKRSLYLYTAVAALGGLLFGFDTAVISGTTDYLTNYFQLTDTSLGWAVSSALLGCILGAFIVGKPGDVYGRRDTLKVMGFLFLVSALGTGLATNFTVFIIFRFVGGVAVGGASVLSPMYISEIAPPAHRGRLVAVSQLAIVSGILVAFFSNFLLGSVGEQPWRWMFLAEAVPAILFLLFLFTIKKSPRWLVKNQEDALALEVIKKVNGEEGAEQLLQEIKASIDQEAIKKDVAIFKPPYRKLVFIGIAVGMFNQLTGINVIMYYAPSIFKTAGFSEESALLQTVLIGVTNLAFTLLAMTVIDRFGRKFLLYLGAVGMAIFLGLFSYDYLRENFGAYNLLVYLMGYIAFFAASQGAVIWVLLSEMFPNNIRSRGTALGSFSHWAFNGIISFLFPVASAQFGVGYVFAFFCLGVIVSIWFYYKFLVETKGLSLEDLEKRVLSS